MPLHEIRATPLAKIEIPVELARLGEITYNLWWSWSTRAHLLFHRIDSSRWLRYRNPVELLINLEPHRWDRLLVDREFLAAYHELVEEYDRYMTGETGIWFQQAHPGYAGGPVAYFSTEYGWHDALGIYSGGLGILSGDHCKSASDLGIPFLGIGLMYRRGYFMQTIDPDGLQQHFYPDFDLHRLPLRVVVGKDGKELRVAVNLAGREVHVRVWKVQVGRVPVLLLDTDIEENESPDRSITSILYVQGREMRLCQEYLLGVGGVRALRSLGIQPSVWHINEGHSALLALERIRDRVEKDRISFDEARRRTLGNALFTTHTPVPAGNETFDNSLIAKYLGSLAEGCNVAVDDLLPLGKAGRDGDDGQFNLTALAIRTTNETNGVSELHGRVADEMWRHLWPGHARDQRAVTHVTNGVHTPTWMGPEIQKVLMGHLGQDFLQNLMDSGFEDAVMAIPDEEIWDAHQVQKKRMILFTRDRIRQQFTRHGHSPDELRTLQDLLDPEYLTIGFARRFATYKRAALIFRDMESLRSIVGSEERPVQILFAGKAHPADRPGQQLIREICKTSRTRNLKGRVLFLENYNMLIARFLVQGVDLWLNTPRRPHEASGTSGMKVAVNGGLNCSVLDGWWCEGYDASHGWAFGEERDYGDPERQDREDAEALHRVLRDEVAPCYYHRDPDSPVPAAWIRKMKTALATLTPRFSTTRMVRDYTEKHYLPASRKQGWGSEFDEVMLWTP